MNFETPALRFLLRLLPSLLLVTLVAALAYASVRTWSRVFPVSIAPRVSPERQVFQLLKSESLSFLVTSRLTSQIIVEIEDSSVLLGAGSGSLTGTVRMYHGVDLRRLTQASVRMEGGSCVVDLPEPEVLDFAVDVASLRFKTRRSLLRVMADRLGGHDLRQDLQNRFRSASDRYFREQSLLPDRSALCARLNEHAQSWSGKVGAEIRFR